MNFWFKFGVKVFENAEDGRGLSYKVELIPEAQDDFYKLDNNNVFMLKILIKLENHRNACRRGFFT